jgi:HEAT repeat protein
MSACNDNEDAYFDKVLQSALHHDILEKRIEMVYILGELHDARALGVLKTITTEDDPYLVSEAVKATGKIGGPVAFEQLTIMAHHSSFMVRGEVALAIRDMDHMKRDELLNQLLRDGSPYVTNCAYLVLNAGNLDPKHKDIQKMRFCNEKRRDQSR